MWAVITGILIGACAGFGYEALRTNCKAPCVLMIVTFVLCLLTANMVVI